MEYYLIKGQFHVIQYSPDGDSIMFKADNPKTWDKIVTNYREVFNKKLEEKDGVVQLRLQGIDALETHYSPSPLSKPKDVPDKEPSKVERPIIGKFRQPVKYGTLATTQLLELFGVIPDSIQWKHSVWGGSYIRKISVLNKEKTYTYDKKHTEKLDGYIVVNDFDRKGRPLSWVFGGNTRTRNGSRLTTSKIEKILKQSANYKLIANGLVYPYFYYTLEAKLRDILMNATIDAQTEKLNIWSEDETNKGITTRRFSNVTDDHVIFPYLFRRLVKHQYRRMMEGYWEAITHNNQYSPRTEALFLDSFFEDTNPYVFLIEEREFKRLNEVIRITKTKIRINTHPGNIVFLS